MNWALYSKKAIRKVRFPLALGCFQQTSEEYKILSAELGSMEEETFVKLSLLVDPEDQVIVDAKYLFYGGLAIVIAMETLASLAIRKTLHQARRINLSLMEDHLQDQIGEEPFPKREARYFLFALDLLQNAISEELLVGKEEERITPLEPQTEGELLHPDWMEYSDEKRLSIVENFLQETILPYLALDEGGAKVTGIANQTEVILHYYGACSSCYSSIGSTLHAIESLLRQRIFPDIKVIVDPRSLQFGEA